LPETCAVLYWGTIVVSRGAMSLREGGGGGEEAGASGEGGGETPAGRRLLMIEDDVALATMYRRRLEHDGHSVEWASTARSGLDLARAQDYDLVFLDIGLPDRDGLDVLEALRRESRATNVVVLTNFSDVHARARSEQLGARAYVVKADVTPAWLAQQVREWI